MTDIKHCFHKENLQNLPKDIRFGTSTWTYPGWKGLIYKQHYPNEKTFKATSLREYASFGLFRTVGIDNTFYSPPSSEYLSRLSAQVPDAFQWVSKVWERITIPRYPTHPRYGKLKGTDNPDFLSSDLFMSEVLKPYQESGVEKHTGPFVFQFPTINKSILQKEAFFDKLHDFLCKLPTHFRYAIEVRNPEYLSNDYFQLLNSTGATHCFNQWNYMPSLKAQMKLAAKAEGLEADFFCSRVLTPLGMKYQDAVKTFQPYTEVKRPNIEMRRDIVTLVRRALKRSNDAFIIINNRAEGCSPITIDEIGRMLVDE